MSISVNIRASLALKANGWKVNFLFGAILAFLSEAFSVRGRERKRSHVNLKHVLSI